MLIVISNKVFGQAGTLDSTYGNNGISYCGSNYGPYNLPFSTMDSDGRMLLLYAFDDSSFILTRYLADGIADITFGNNGQEIFNTGHIYNNSYIQLQQDDRILVAGTIQLTPTDSAYNTDFFLTRFLPDGGIDTSFANLGQLVIDLGNRDYAGCLGIQEDNKILLSGSTDALSTYQKDITLLRLLPNGTPDSSFGDAGRIITNLTNLSMHEEYGDKVLVRPGGKILLLGVVHYWQWDHKSIMRYQSNGIIDSSFGSFGIVTDLAIDDISYWDFVLEEDMSILVGEGGGSVSGGGFRTNLHKYTPDGQIDSAFAVYGKYESSFNGYSLRSFKSLTIQSDHKIVASGVWDDSLLLLMRFTSSGIPDSSFGINGMVTNRFDGLYCSANKVYLYPSDKITLLCASTNYIDTGRVLIVRYNNENVTIGIPNALTANSFALNVYPNPSSDFITFDLGTIVATQAELFIYNTSGALRIQLPVTHSAQLQISVDDIGSDGMYFYTVRTDDQQFFAGKFIIQR